MLHRRIARASLFLIALGLVACSAESKAKSTLDDYEKVFGKCKTLTEEAKLEPGQHGCAEVTSRAVEMGLKSSGLEESQWRPMLESWLKDKGFSAYYVATK